MRLGVTTQGANLLVSRIGALFERYPGLAVELVVREGSRDLIEERLDVAVQLGPPSDTSAVARLLGTFGRPRSPRQRTSSGMARRRIRPIWPVAPASFTTPGRIAPSGSSADRTGRLRLPSRARSAPTTLRPCAARPAGYGVALLPESLAADDIRATSLYRLLTDYPSERHEFYLVYPSRRHLAPRTRAVIDFVVEHTKLMQAWVEAGRVWGEDDAT